MASFRRRHRIVPPLGAAGTLLLRATPRMQAAGTPHLATSGARTTNRLRAAGTVGPSFDLVVVSDTAGGMKPCVVYGQADARAILSHMLSSLPDSPIAVEAFRNYPVSPYCETTNYRYHDAQGLTANTAAVHTVINSLSAADGGDTSKIEQ